MIYNLTKDRDALGDEREALKDEQDQLKTNSRNLTEERDALRGERDLFKVLSSNLRKDRDTLRDEQNLLKVLSRNLTEDIDALRDERDALTGERGTLKDERDQLEIVSQSLTKERNTLRDERNSLRNERDQLKIQYSNLMKKMEALQSQYNTLAAGHNNLQAEINRLKAKTCPRGWTMFNNKCYFYSPSGHGKTWENSQQDCQQRGGHLAMPKTTTELDFVSRGNMYTWIGLSDKLQEDRWRWVDGSELKDWSFWKQGEPNNANNNEDCVEVAQNEAKWNDAACSTEFGWVCEAMSFGGDSRYLMTIDDGEKNERSLSVVWRIGAAVVCLVLLLLTVILVAHNTSAINGWDAKYEDLIYNLTKDRGTRDKQDKIESSSLTQTRDIASGEQDALRNEREALKEERGALTSERNQLQNYSRSLTKDRDALKDEREALKEERGQLKIYSSNMTTERDDLRDERKALRDERAALKNERDQFKIQSSNLTEYKGFLKEEQGAIKDERDALTIERAALKVERNDLKVLIFNLTKDRDTLIDERDAFRIERDQLKINSSKLNKELGILQGKYNTVAQRRDMLQDDLNRLKLNQTASCFPGWKLHNNKCYYYSPKGKTDTWEKSRADCLARGGDLAMPKTESELVFVSRGNSYSWIGLSDNLQEGVWQWVDGTDLEGPGSWKEGEPNDAGNEDCVELSRDEVKWNDAPCRNAFSWTCESLGQGGSN
ncbi:CD209 antigen-like [Labrus mixtus]|uniref:CD209 antigen-like n=1 Tax=Labrus mixtus TaxID=508554 RepID=UPI0029C0D714|nr:CD209 antigen-like [Labrus mixtus]